ncbi:TfuA-like protein [Verminephrobacter aporrectodeae]|uniref:TfuA-related McrA-glycine thioamidation protein n=1 Tax=Verminephrobacter aporrectodeae subsp. tuberculatae TaxID=1110392 RepID=A0ABT3KXZ2_9BURK|nr:TfuA-like protein [Verminephrobacter aporrectodeae]MCW5256439.1 TfuA-related McrA-glycine thioamidation protein [Verminephrobacter aporrectodeae subsp. tuberculatae]MCW5323198.1 TfuA-related McrA-glycine thioamidation protein [Verminephrobacter aporrectodeae subsp. tuberculatae]MCW8177263.1 TfuA-related McrA-glycine thioamidation protein [Verminephrobacter aporrectodeae subsp. tuberculatae]MCW8200337.1 TfuA-related McrA-glycine thioamidation protein [Verminephrobacter aporrectodeae subsp. tu
MTNIETLTAVLFVGPSLAGHKTAELFPPHVQIRGPIQRGDMDALPQSTTDVLLVDGVFHSTLAVSAREVLAALRRGIHVYGSSSMGALRAAELGQFGMVGIGGVYDMYRSGLVNADAEVALTYDSECYLPLSEPLVNIRYALRCGCKKGLLNADLAGHILQLASQFNYYELNYCSLFQSLTDHLPSANWQPWREFVLDDLQAVNLKSLDAIELARHYSALVQKSRFPNLVH